MLVCRLEFGTKSLIAYRFFECRSNCFAKRNWQEHSSDAVAVVKEVLESNLAEMLTKVFGRSKIEEFCAETLVKESKRVKKTKEVKFAVKAIEMDETVKNRFKDARIAMDKNKLKDARLAKIKNESKVEKLQWMHTMD